MKLMALDVGTKRIGIAKADSSVRIPVPYSAIPVDGGEFQKIASLARAWSIDGFVIGLPRNSQGEETEQSKYSRAFARQLKTVIPDAKVCFQDESLTSVEAEQRLSKRKRGYAKGEVDSEAATIILQDFLESHTGKKPAASKPAAARHASVKARKPHKLLIAVIILVVLLIGAGAGGWFYYQHNLEPVLAATDCEGSDSSDCRPLVFAVNSGDSVGTVAANLKNADLIRSPLVFQIFYRFNFSDQTLKAGEYDLEKTMTPADILTLLTSGSDSNVFSFTVLPGETLFEVRDRLLEAGYTEAAVTEAFNADYSGEEFAWIFNGRPEGASLEGYLYGETYEFYRDDTPTDIVRRMLSEFATVASENDLENRFAVHGLNLYQGITLASIVQKEVGIAADQAKVAQVFYNRLGAGWNLGSDASVQYALDLVDPDRTTYTTNEAALAIDSPYNTRLYAGLTPGPISNPSLSALLAVAEPDTSVSSAWYFLTGDDGVTYYSSTEEEHQANITAHCSIRCNVAL